jgi:hypothetical protein
LGREDEVLLVRGEIGVLWGACDVGHGIGHEAREGEFLGSVVGAVHFSGYVLGWSRADFMGWLTSGCLICDV